MKLSFYKLHEEATIPTFGTEQSACFDFSACLQDGTDITVYDDHNDQESFTLNEATYFDIEPGERVLVPTGLAADIPEGFTLKMYPRSSTGLKLGLTFPHNVGIIDSDYVFPIFILIKNASSEKVRIVHGQRLAQGMLVKVEQYDIEEIFEQPTQKTSRIGGGGSTGK